VGELRAARRASDRGGVSAYPRELNVFTPVSLALRYLNALPLDREELPLVAFLRNRLHTSLSVDPALFEDPGAAEKPAGLQFSMTYPLPSIPGSGSISFASGRVAGKPASVREWTRAAHATLSRWFTTLSRGNLASQFAGLAK
jgi:hypothetical protein